MQNICVIFTQRKVGQFHFEKNMQNICVTFTHRKVGQFHFEKTMQNICVTFTQRKVGQFHLEKNMQNICVTFTHRKVRQFHLEIEGEMYGSSHNVRVMYDLNENKQQCIFRSSARKFVTQLHNFKWDKSTEILKKCGCRHIEKIKQWHFTKNKNEAECPLRSNCERIHDICGTFTLQKVGQFKGKCVTVERNVRIIYDL